MTCEKCGHKEVIYSQKNSENSILRCCPVCGKLNVLPKEESLKLIEEQYLFLDGLFISHIKKFDKKSLIIWLLGYREKSASKFINESLFIKLDEFLSLNIIIKRIMQIYKEVGLIKANEENTTEILRFYLNIVRTKEIQFSIEEDFGYIIGEEDSTLRHLNSNNFFSNFKLVHDEDWMIVIDSFNQNLIMPREAAEKYIMDNKEDYEKVKATSSESREFTPEETIHNLYNVLQSFKIGLTKNSLFAETFNFDYLEDKRVLIELFPKLTKYFNFESGTLLVVSVEEFKQFLSKEFGELNQNRLYTDLVFSYDNQDVFPFFVELKDITVTTNETVMYNSLIFISRSLFSILGIFYYPFYYKDLFDKETQLLSDQFEKIEVPKEFHDNCFNVRVNIIKKDIIQVDTIAWNNDILYIIETKIWDVREFFEHRRTHNYRERDLKGIVDGYKFIKEGKKRIPDLISKINYVKDNFIKILSDYKETEMFPDHDTIDNSTDRKIVGLIVTKSYPPIKEYNGVMMIGYKEIKDL